MELGVSTHSFVALNGLIDQFLMKIVFEGINMYFLGAISDDIAKG